MKLSICGKSNDGRQRDHNEDSFIILADIDNLWSEVNNQKLNVINSRGVICILADGMGGANAGELASEIAVKTVAEEIQKMESVPKAVDEIKKFMISMILTGHKRILKAARRSNENKGMGTTLVIAWFINQYIFVAWSGDSRCYLYRPEESKVLYPFTDDHSLVWERVKNGEITPEEARLSDESNLILQSLGGSLQKPEPDFRWGKINQNDRILVCSDGLNSMLSDVGIQQILEFEKNTCSTCQALVDSANNAGGYDNITVAIIDILEDEPGSHETAPPVTRKRRGIYRRFLIFLLALLLILTGYLFRNPIGSVFNSAPSKQQELELDSEGMIGDNTNRENAVPDYSQAESASSFRINQGTKSTSIDSSRINNALRTALEDLLLVKKHLLVAEQSENVSFFKENRIILDSIYRQFTSLDSSIRSVATYRLNSIQLEIDGFEVNDFTKANGIYLEVFKACNNLKMITESLIVQGN